MSEVRRYFKTIVSGCLRFKMKKLSHKNPSFISDTSSVEHKTGMPFQRSCPKCNVQFNLLDALKYHMKVKFFKFLCLEMQIFKNIKDSYIVNTSLSRHLDKSHWYFHIT